jgi:hypothetical protein
MDVTIDLMANDGVADMQILSIFEKSIRIGLIGDTMYLVFNKIPIMKKESKTDRKVHKVMGEFKEHTLKSSSGKKVTSRKQAIAIAMSESGKGRKK